MPGVQKFAFSTYCWKTRARCHTCLQTLTCVISRPMWLLLLHAENLNKKSSILTLYNMQSALPKNWHPLCKIRTWLLTLSCTFLQICSAWKIGSTYTQIKPLNCAKTVVVIRLCNEGAILTYVKNRTCSNFDRKGLSNEKTQIRMVTLSWQALVWLK